MAALPAIYRRDIKLPDGSITYVLEGADGMAYSVRPTPNYYPVMPTLRGTMSADPNTGTAMFESADIVAYLERTYAA